MLPCPVFPNRPHPLPPCMPRLLLVATTLLLAARSAPAQEANEAGGARESVPGVVTVLLVRHAEAGDNDPRDPDLAPPGQERARQLARVLQDVPVTHLFASEYRRTQQTLEPLAAQSGRDIQIHEARDAAGLVARLRQLPEGAHAVVAGHSNTVPDLVRRLGGDPGGLLEHPKHGWLLPHDEHSRLFVVTLDRVPGAATARFSGCLQLRYGAE